MPYYFYEDEIEDMEPADVIERSDYEAVAKEVEDAKSQRDEAIFRAEEAEKALAEEKQKYADTFLRTQPSFKQKQESRLPQSLEELFG